jgi:hypothetical protein
VILGVTVFYIFFGANALIRAYKPENQDTSFKISQERKEEEDHRRTGTNSKEAKYEHNAKTKLSRCDDGSK